MPHRHYGYVSEYPLWPQETRLISSSQRDIERMIGRKLIESKQIEDRECDLCGDPIVYGDERNMWIDYHTAWYHKAFYVVKRFFLV